AMNTGHAGSMATVHANTPRDALTRMQAMIGMSGVQMNEQVITQMIARALDLIVQLVRTADGKRRMVSISEITGAEGTIIQMQDIFVWKSRGVDQDGNAIGAFSATGVRPRCMDRLEKAGCFLDPTVFVAGRR